MVHATNYLWATQIVPVPAQIFRVIIMWTVWMHLLKSIALPGRYSECRAAFIERRSDSIGQAARVGLQVRRPRQALVLRRRIGARNPGRSAGYYRFP